MVNTPKPRKVDELHAFRMNEGFVPMRDEKLLEMIAKHRRHTELASHYGQMYLHKSEGLEEYFDENPFAFGDDFNRRKAKEANWGVNDAMKAWRWHADEASRFGIAIQTELACRSAAGLIEPAIRKAQERWHTSSSNV